MPRLTLFTQSLWRRWMRWIPVRILSVKHRPKISAHLKSLDPHDRYLRFGYPATDEQIDLYVEKLNFGRDDIYGVFNRRLEIVAMAHLAFSVDPQWTTCAEFGVSVDQKMRGRGLGARLFERAVVHARNEGVALLFIHALSENTPMLKIARKAGATLERDGAETQALLKVPKGSLKTRIAELFTDQYAQINYSIKEDVKNFWYFLTQVQEIREGVRAGRHQSAE